MTRAQAILDRVRLRVSQLANLVPADNVTDPVHRAAGEAVAAMIEGIRSVDDADRARAAVDRALDRGEINEFLHLTARADIEAHPNVRRFDRADELLDRFETAARHEGGPRLNGRLAMAKRIRGANRFDQGKYGEALELFAESLDLHPAPPTFVNVLAALGAAGEVDKALGLAREMRNAAAHGGEPERFWAAAAARIRRDPDAQFLRPEI